MKWTELKLSKKDKGYIILDSDNFRDFGYGHMKLDSGKELVIGCGELVKNREDFEKYLVDKGLDFPEINKPFKKK